MVSDMGVSLNGGTPKSSILEGSSIINHPFWGTTIFGNTHMVEDAKMNLFYHFEKSSGRAVAFGTLVFVFFFQGPRSTCKTSSWWSIKGRFSMGSQLVLWLHGEKTPLMFQHLLSLQGMAWSIGLRLWNQRVGAKQKRKRMKRDEEGLFHCLWITTLVLLCGRFWILRALRLYCWRWINVQDLHPGSPWKPAPIAPRQELVKDLTRKVLRIMSNVLPPNHSDVCSSVLLFPHVKVRDEMIGSGLQTCTRSPLKSVCSELFHHSQKIPWHSWMKDDERLVLHDPRISWTAFDIIFVVPRSGPNGQFHLAGPWTPLVKSRRRRQNSTCGEIFVCGSQT